MASALSTLHSYANAVLLRAWCASPLHWLQRCATFGPGARHTTSEAADLPDSEVFSRPEFMILGVGNRYPQGRGHRFGGVLKPHVHPVDLSNRRMVFVTPEGAKAMSKVYHLASRSAAPTLPATGTSHDPIQLHAQAHNALSMALHYLRQPSGNVPGAARKVTQALAALRRLAAVRTASSAHVCTTCRDNFPLPQADDVFDAMVIAGYVERRTACDLCPTSSKPCLTNGRA